MASSSESEEFYDAEADTPVKTSLVVIDTSEPDGKNSKATDVNDGRTDSPVSHSKDENSTNLSSVVETSDKDPKTEVNIASLEIKEQKRFKEKEKRKKKLEDMRKRMMTEDEDLVDISSPASSCASSADGVFLNQNFAKIKSDAGSCTGSHSKSIPSDTVSVMSLGKVGQLLASDGSSMATLQSTSSSICDPTPILSPEPDIVASAKSSERQSSQISQPPPRPPAPEHAQSIIKEASQPEPTAPVAPPRRRKKKVANVFIDKQPQQGLGADDHALPSLNSTIESITKDLDFSLDIKSAIKGKYVVKPQDDDRARAEGPPSSAQSPCGEDKPATPSQCHRSMKSPNSSLGSRSGRASSGNSLSGSRAGSKPSSKTGSPSSTYDISMMMRPRSDSGRQLTDLEILEQVTVLNLDTGERIPLSLAEDRLPQTINPLSLHIMRLTSEYVSNSDLEKDDGSDAESIVSINAKKSTSSETGDGRTVRRKATRLKKMLGRTVEMTVNKIKSVADEVYHVKHSDDMYSSDEDVGDGNIASKNIVKVKASGSHKGPYEFDNIKLVQQLGSEHHGAIWTMKFSYCGRLLATAGQDHILRIWVLRDSNSYFADMRQKYNAEARKVSPSPSQESLSSYHSNHSSTEAEVHINKMDPPDVVDESSLTFMSKPFCVYQGHTADVLDVSWSKNYFILSSSMDKTVRLWHISRKECLCCFQHIDFVTAIAFHPRDDRYFISGSLDGKLRLWNIPDKKVALWNEMEGSSKLITAANFCQNGKFAVVGSYDGRCVFYSTEQLKYYTQIHVRSTRGKNAKGRKVTGIEPMPGEGKILVTSNDSRIRLYDLRDLSLSCKYKGYVNLSSQIKANFSHDGKYIISGSENQNIYLWKSCHDLSKFSSVRRDRNDYWEGIKAHNAVVTSAVFAPNPSAILRQYDPDNNDPLIGSQASEAQPQGYVLVSADFSGGIKVFVNMNKDKASTSFQQHLPTIPPL